MMGRAGENYAQGVTRTSRLSGLDASGKIRLAFVVLSGLLAIQRDSVKDVLPWLLLVVVLDLVIVGLEGLAVARPGAVNSMVLTLMSVSAAAAGAAYAVAGDGAALLILIPAYHAGSKYGRRGFLLTCAVAMVAFLLALWLHAPRPTSTVAAAAWIGAAVTLGVLGAWNQRLIAAEHGGPDDDPAAREAIELIQRLQDLSGQMSTGLDAPASATLALDLLSAEVPSTRSAVLVTHDAEHLVPVALRGSTRAPWHIAEHLADLLRTNPASWVPTEVTFADELGRRNALVVPFALGNGSTTVVIAERPVGRPFTDNERRIARDVTRRIAPALQAGLLFGALRQFASIEERNRIARDIHDGIAQELAALGYQVDALRSTGRAARQPDAGRARRPARAAERRDGRPADAHHRPAGRRAPRHRSGRGARRRRAELRQRHGGTHDGDRERGPASPRSPGRDPHPPARHGHPGRRPGERRAQRLGDPDHLGGRPGPPRGIPRRRPPGGAALLHGPRPRRAGRDTSRAHRAEWAHHR